MVLGWGFFVWKQGEGTSTMVGDPQTESHLQLTRTLALEKGKHC